MARCLVLDPALACRVLFACHWLGGVNVCVCLLGDCQQEGVGEAPEAINIHSVWMVRQCSPLKGISFLFQL